MTEKAIKLGDEPVSACEASLLGYDKYFGLNKREFFAGLAMWGLLSNERKDGAPEEYANDAAMFSEALLEELAK
jgi:hypothetical protein